MTDIKILHLVDGAKEAEGAAVIIDVFRAFTLEPWLYHAGADEIYAVYDETVARRLKAKHPSALLAGERHGRILPGFDFGNSPSIIETLDVKGKKIIHTTSNGTLGIANASHADVVMAASLVNAKATVQYIKQLSVSCVSLVCMGWEGRRTEEDELCALYLKSLLEEHPMEDIRKQADALRYSEGKKFFDPAQQDVFPEKDFAYCIDVDRLPIAIVCEKVEDYYHNRKVIMHA